MPHFDPTLSIAERVDATCDRFEQEWRAGRSPRVEDYVAAALESDREELRRQLLALEQELQAQGAADTSVSRSSVRAEPSPALGRTIDHVEAGDLYRQTIGRFQIHGKLGRGAFGQVYRAFDPHLGREVAIKVPLETAVATPTDREKFLKEARAAATINHANVCQIHEVGEHNGRPYIVMALVKGQSLADHLKPRKEPISEKQAALIVRKVALALAAAHDKGIVHRDLKPANIMFDRERKDVIVMDFGLARGPRMGDARGTQSGVIMGTPAYMSPEQASGGSKDVGPAGDIYSLGVVLYEILTGTRPFQGSATEVIGQILHVEPEKPSQRRAGIDPRLESICLKAMAKRPEERFASMKEFATAIDTVLRTPKPTSGSAETIQPVATRRDSAEATSSENMADLFAVMSIERKASRAETAAVVEAAMAKHRTPRWVFVAIGVVILFGFIALGGIIFYARTPTATVMINIDVDLNDKTLSFFLDGKQVPAESLQAPIELKVGTHELIVKRGEEVIRKFTFTVSRDAGPRIELREETPPRKEPLQSEPKLPDDLTRWQGTWHCVAEHSRGKRLTDEELKQRGTIMRIEGNRRQVERTLDGRFSRYDGTFQLNPAKSPKEFDYDDQQGQGPRNYHRGVYEFDGERLRLIYRHAQGNVPQRAGWNDIGQANVVWFEFERVPEEPDRKLAEWLLSLPHQPGAARAVFVATEDGQVRRLDDVKLLPASKFRVTQLDLWGNKNVNDANVEPILQWLERSRVDTIGFLHGNDIGDATVEKLVKIKTLKSIWLGGTKITDRSLELLATRPDLRLTGFDGTKITDAGVAHLARMTELESLSFYNTPLTDAGLKHLVGLKKLRILGLGVTKITPQGLRLLKDLPIERLNIIACHPVASDLKVLKEFPRLGHLEASGLKLIDRDADLLAELQTLETLALNHNRLTDEGLQKLTALKNLKELAITDNPVTAEGVAKFQKALPRCVVHWDKK